MCRMRRSNDRGLELCSTTRHCPAARVDKAVALSLPYSLPPCTPMCPNLHSQLRQSGLIQGICMHDERFPWDLAATMERSGGQNANSKPAGDLAIPLTQCRIPTEGRSSHKQHPQVCDTVADRCLRCAGPELSCLHWNMSPSEHGNFTAQMRITSNSI
jgi:hypothetical protein